MSTKNKEKYWTRRYDARLVKYIERRRWVWDPTHPHYTSTTKRNQVYEDFSAKHGSHFSADSVKDRWINIRSTFSSVLKKVEATRNTNSDKSYEPKWHLWKACQFLMRVKKGVDPSVLQELIGDEVKIEMASDLEEDQNLQPSADEETTDSEKYQGRVSTEETLNCNDVVNGIVDAFNNIQNGMFGFKEEHAKIGRLVSERLSKMNSYDAAVTSTKIMEILLFYEEDNRNKIEDVEDEKNFSGDM